MPGKMTPCYIETPGGNQNVYKSREFEFKTPK